jgi:hypothetical protein
MPAECREVTMNQIMARLLGCVALTAAVCVPVQAADSDRPKQSLQDARPECMERTGPNCVIDDGPRGRRRSPAPGASPAAAGTGSSSQSGAPQGAKR